MPGGMRQLGNVKICKLYWLGRKKNNSMWYSEEYYILRRKLSNKRIFKGWDLNQVHIMYKIKSYY
jgi:hypothetical protein